MTFKERFNKASKSIEDLLCLFTDYEVSNSIEQRMIKIESIDGIFSAMAMKEIFEVASIYDFGVGVNCEKRTVIITDK